MAFGMSSTLYSSAVGVAGNVTRGAMYHAMGDDRKGNLWSFALNGAVAGAIGGAMSSMTYLAANQVASSFNKPNTVETIGVTSENIGGYMNDLVLGNSMYGGELNAIYVTASQDYYNVSIFAPSPKFGAVPIYYNYQVPFKL